MKTSTALRHFLTAAMLAASSAHAAFTIIATDDVDSHLNYTSTGSVLASPATTLTGGVGNGDFVRYSAASGSVASTDIRLTNVFPTIVVAVGTYKLSAYSGAPVGGRTPWTDFDLFLMSSSGTAWGGTGVTMTETDGYVTPSTGTWEKVEVTYVITSAATALLGQSFTWGFNGDKPSGAYAVAFDSAQVQFEAAIPEPNAAALIGGFGILALLRRRRH